MFTYISSHSSELFDNAISKAILIQDDGKVPLTYNADTTISTNDANKSVNCDFAEIITNVNYANNTDSANTAMICNDYLPLSGGVLTNKLTCNNICRNDQYYILGNYSDSGNVEFTTSIKFNNISQNIGNCYNTSTGRFTCPVKGIYNIVFNAYSNSDENPTYCRPAILKNGSRVIFTNGLYGWSLNINICCNAGDYLEAGAYSTTFPITTWAGAGHNEFMVTLIHELK